MSDNPTKYVAFDTETEMMSYHNPLPKMMCMTYANCEDFNKGSLVTPWEHPVDQMVKEWWATETHTPGQNMSFDLSILAFNYPDMMPHIFDALDKGLVHDTMLREKLLNITLHGSIKFVEVNGANIRCDYSLAGLERKYLNIDRSDLKKNPDAPRTNYNIYDGVPAAQWGELFVSYAVDDAINTGMIFNEQEKARQECIAKTGFDPFHVESYKVKSAWALRLLECAGTRLDPVETEKTAKRFMEDYLSPRLLDPLTNAGFRTAPIPPMPYAKGTLDHTDECKGSTDPAQAANRKNKVCGCPVKMKKAEPEHSPTKPLHQHIWNLAGDNSEIEAWANDSTRIALKKEGSWKEATTGKAFKQAVIKGFAIDTCIANIEATLNEWDSKANQAVIALDTAITNMDNESVMAARSNIKTVNKGAVKARTQLAHAIKCKEAGHRYLLPDNVALTTAAEWSETFADRDPLLTLWTEREKLKKIINEYLPKMYYTDENENTYPAEILRSAYGPLVLTGRSHSWASSLYPSRSDQTVDPRVRPCTIPRDGNVIVSTDYNGMELGTLAQRCFNLFGHSELANKINDGIDTHAFLAAQIAYNLDPTFRKILDEGTVKGTDYIGVQNKDDIYSGFSQTKGADKKCLSDAFVILYKADYFKKKGEALEGDVTWANFFKYYRTMAKPVNLGYPGMLGAATQCKIAKAAYGVELTKELAVTLKGIWLETYPEMVQYLEYVKKQCFDGYHMPIMEEDEDGVEKQRKYYAYDTPRGMHRAKCGICEAANGQALQAPSAEGALDGLYEVQRACWLAKEGDILYLTMPIMFIHDEIVWECPDDDKVGQRARAIEAIMVQCMEKITPNVKAGAESAAMRRWSKFAEPIWSEDGLTLSVWEPEEKEDKEVA